MSSGILLLDKPQGLSSNGALQRVRALLHKVKAGHIGSLDPLATGMLPICLGEATKVAGEILAGRKRYRFTVRLGERTDTGDAQGAVIARAAVPPLSRPAVEAVLARFLGVTEQVPPMYSALKRGGRPLYQLARAGIEVERAPRRIELHELALCELGGESLELETLCSKGTYVRSLAEDIAQALHTLGHVTALRRLYVEPFQDQPMQRLEALQQGAAPALLAVDWPLRHLPALQLSGVQAQRLAHGQRIVLGAAATPRARIYDADGRFLGLGETDAAGTLHPRRLINVPGAASGPAP